MRKIIFILVLFSFLCSFSYGYAEDYSIDLSKLANVRKILLNIDKDKLLRREKLKPLHYFFSKEEGEGCFVDIQCVSAFCHPFEKVCSPNEVKGYLQQGTQTVPGEKITINLSNIDLEGKTSEEAVVEISDWIRNAIINSSYNSGVQLSSSEKGSKAAEKMVAKKEHAQGCTDTGVMFVSIARALGFPTIFVDTYRLDTIESLEDGVSPQMIYGHVFVNIFIGGEWRIFDPVHGDFHDPVASSLCQSDIDMPGPEGCYYISGIEEPYIVTGKGLDFWDLGFSNRQEANQALFQEYDL